MYEEWSQPTADENQVHSFLIPCTYVCVHGVYQYTSLMFKQEYVVSVWGDPIIYGDNEVSSDGIFGLEYGNKISSIFIRLVYNAKCINTYPLSLYMMYLIQIWGLEVFILDMLIVLFNYYSNCG